MQEVKQKNIAQNTFFLYFRMMFNMVVALFTSRVILRTLGVEDFGIFQIVGGVVAMLSFLNGALATGSDRFLAYELGTGDRARLRRTFSTVLMAHVILALVVVVVLETVGLWYLHQKANIPTGRMHEAVFAYHVSVLASVFAITQIPYDSSIIAHEHMSAFAYISIVEVSLRLVIAYLLCLSPLDKLCVYASLYCAVQILVALSYRWYCVRHFEETRFALRIDRAVLRDVLVYASWNLLDNTSIAISNQGATLLLSSFFNPSVVAARAIANQVNMATHQFMNNFGKAFTPQVVKRYAAGDAEGSKRLLLDSTRYTYYLMLCLCLPIWVTARQLLGLWLGVVPEYADTFLRLAVVTSLFQSFNLSFYTALSTNGRIKENSIICPIVTLTFFPITYVLFTMGYPPVTISAIQMVLYAVIALVVKPILVIRIADYRWSEIVGVFRPCLRVTLTAPVVPLVYRCCLYHSLPLPHVVGFVVQVLLCVGCTLASVWWLGIDRATRDKVRLFVSRQFKH